MKKRLMATMEKCTGCGRCALICSALKEGEFIPSRSRIHVTNFALQGLSFPNVCFHCEDPDCARACPVEAITRHACGAVVVDHEICTGCGECVIACPYGMLNQEINGIAYKCDLCYGDPECVKVCEQQAIVFQEIDDAFRKELLDQMAKKITEGRPEEKRFAAANSFRQQYRVEV